MRVRAIVPHSFFGWILFSLVVLSILLFVFVLWGSGSGSTGVGP